MRVTKIRYPREGEAVIAIKCLCGARFEVPVDRRKFAECVQCKATDLMNKLAERYHTEQMIAKIGE